MLLCVYQRPFFGSRSASLLLEFLTGFRPYIVISYVQSGLVYYTPKQHIVYYQQK